MGGVSIHRIKSHLFCSGRLKFCLVLYDTNEWLAFCFRSGLRSTEQEPMFEILIDIWNQSVVIWE
jgi:hypothetical protein